MSILAVNVALPLPVVAGLLVGPGLAVHTIAKQILARFDLKHDFAVCAFSATVSGAAAFALIESAAIVAAVALATFSVLLAYEYLRLESARPQPVNLKPVLEAIRGISQQAPTIDLSPVLTAIGRLPQEMAGEVDFKPLLQAIRGVRAAVTEAIKGISTPDLAEPLQQPLASLKVSPHISEEGKAGQDLAEIKAKGNEVLDFLKRWKQTPDSAVADALQALTVRVEALSAPQQGEAEGSINQDTLDRVLQGIADIKSAGTQLKDVPQNVLATYSQVQEATQQAMLAAAGYTTLEKTLGDLNEALRRIEHSLIELKATGQANARVVESALQRSQSVPVGPLSMYGGSIHQWGIDAQSVASDYGRTPTSFQQPPLARAQSLQNLSGTSDRSRSPDARSVFSEVTTPMAPRGEGTPFDVDRTPLAPQVRRAKTPETVKRPQPVARAPMAEGGSLKQKILAMGGRRFYKDYEDMNPVSVSKRHLHKPIAQGHFFVNRDLNEADAAAILHILDQGRLKLSATFIAIPEGLDLGFGSAKFYSLIQADLAESPRHSALTLAAQDGQEALLEHFIAAGAPTDHVVENRCYLGFAAAAGLAGIIEKYAESDFGIGQRVPLVFDAVCADDRGATLRVLIQKGLYSKSINNPCGCTSKHKDRIGRVVPRNTSVNAVHLSILLQDQVKVEALLECDSVAWDQKTEGRGVGSPLLLLLNWVTEDLLDEDHWAVKAACRVIGKLKEKNLLARAIKDEKRENKWFTGQGRDAVQTSLQFTELIKGCTEKTRAALNRALA